MDQRIVQRVQETPFTTVTSLMEEFGGISYWTIRRRLHENGIFSFIPARQTKMTDLHREKRVQFCEENYGRDWDKVIFSDEKTFKSSSDRTVSLWRPRKQRYNPKYVQNIKLSGRITCGVWAYITSGGPGEICETTPRMNSQEYASILEDVYIPSMNALFGNEMNEFFFMQDNARIHTSAHMRTWFHSHPEIILLNWPAYSPDLNPIENLWANMIYNWPDQVYRNRNEIMNMAKTIWENFRGTNEVQNLYGSMQNRLREVIDFNGNWCSY